VQQNVPLSGIKVVEFAHMVMGPTVGLVLADLGADVIKVEPIGGDKTRRLKGSGSGYFAMYNRNKRSICLDLKSDEGRAIAMKMIASADVFVENFRPGALEKLGFGYEALSALNEKLVYCSEKGFLSGPYENRTALDEVAQMMGGLAYMTGPPGQPLRAGSSVIDVTGGMFGVIATISYSFVFMFILFGAFLVRSGAGDFIIDFARAVAGKLIGGPGFVAVIGSALMGTISGSAVANTVSTGVITIPLMKRAGFPAKFAAGVEATASTGGMLMPPIMGAGAFVMASYTQISYLTIAAVSLLPALLYFFGVACFVRVEAKKQNMATTDADAPRLLSVMKRGITFFIPISLLIYMLIDGFTPTYAAGYAILATIVASWFTKTHRMGPKEILEALATGSRNMIMTAVLLVSIGIVVNAVTLTGIGNTFSLMISNWAGGNILIALVLIALASLVLGMGLPVTASYIVLATLSAPALSDMIVQSELVNAFVAGNVPDAAKAIFMLVAPDKLDLLNGPMSKDAAEALVAAIPPEMMGTVKESTLTPAVLTTALLSAHMIIYWLSLDSNVTPPVCLTAFAAAAIAKSPPMATGFTAWKIAKTLYIVPVLFAYTPFLNGDPILALEIFAFALVGIYALIGAMEGYLEAPVAWPMRIVLFAIGITILWPNDWTVNFIGTGLFLAFFAWNLRADRRLRAATA